MQEKICLFCLEAVKEQEQIPNIIGCDCELSCHAICMQNWFETKHQLECPVCHTINLLNVLFQRHGTDNIQIVYVESLRSQLAITQLERRRWQEKCAAGSCLFLIFLGIFVNVLTYYF